MHTEPTPSERNKGRRVIGLRTLNPDFRFKQSVRY